MPIRFTKSHVMGNDCILTEAFTQRVYDPETLAILLTDRTFGIGGESLVTVSPAEVPESRAQLAVFAADGTDADPAGFTPFCAAKLLFDCKIVSENKLSLAVKGENLSFGQISPNRRGVSLICGTFARLPVAEVTEANGLVLHPVGNLIVLRTDESFPEVNGPGEINIAAVATKVGEIPGMKGVPFLIANIGAERTVRARLWVPGRGEVRIRLDAIRALTELFGQEERLTVSMTGGEAKTEISDGQVTITLPVTTVFDGTTVV